MIISHNAKLAADKLYTCGFLYLGIKGREKPIEQVHAIIQSAIDAFMAENCDGWVGPIITKDSPFIPSELYGRPKPKNLK